MGQVTGGQVMGGQVTCGQVTGGQATRGQVTGGQVMGDRSRGDRLQGAGHGGTGYGGWTGHGGLVTGDRSSFVTRGCLPGRGCQDSVTGGQVAKDWSRGTGQGVGHAGCLPGGHCPRGCQGIARGVACQVVIVSRVAGGGLPRVLF